MTTPAAGGTRFWLRWALRDLRNHWVAVLAIALVIAIGIGLFAGLGSTATWRRDSNDASFAELAMHDLQVQLSPGTFTAQASLLAAADSLGRADDIAARHERLVVDTQIDASTDGASILAAARIVGMDLDGAVDTIWVRDGVLPPADGDAGVLELKFADHWGLADSGTVVLAGGRVLDYTGLGVLPEDFFYEGPEGTLLAEGELAPVYLPLATAQRVLGRPGEVNELVLTVREGADWSAIADELRAAVDGLGVSATVSTRDDAYAVQVLYDDIENDQRFWNALAGLVLAAAALAAFNLIARIVEAQRREIGIGMALGVSRRLLAIRPMLVGLQVAVLGTVAGVGVGVLVGAAMGNVIETFLPLPVQIQSFQPATFAQGAVLGIVVPLVACAIPVARAVRVEPIEAIRTGHLTAKANRFTDWTGRLRIPGSSLTQMPVRNVLRTPRRTLLTALGVGAAITALVTVLGLLDSFGRTIDDANAEFTQGDPDRLLVQLDTFHPIDAGVVAAIAENETVARIDAGLRVPIIAPTEGSGDDLDLLVELIDFETSSWTPTTTEPLGDEPGIVLAEKAASDLGVEIGDSIEVVHPVRLERGAFTLSSSTVRVGGTHVNPMRVFAFMDLGEADRFGLDGAVNFVHAYPVDGVDRDEARQALFGLPGIASSQSVGRIGESFDEALDQFVSILVIAASAVLVLALLIAFNSTRITVEERRREHATMRAFGLPVRSIMGVVIKESVLVGLIATLIGVIGGSFFLGWILQSLATTTLPDIRIERYISATTVSWAAIIGVVAVSLAPIFLLGRIRRMNIPDTLRVME